MTMEGLTNMANQKLTAQFQHLTRKTKWELKECVQLQFNNFHAQGMVRMGDLFYLSSVELIKESDLPRKGIGHLFVFDRDGKLKQDIILGESEIYHPGGIDFDGEHIWVPVAEYRPNSQSIIYNIHPTTLEVKEAFRIQEHIGGLVRDRQNGNFIGYSWGSRRFYTWNREATLLQVQDNPSHFVDYQDGHYVGDGKIIVSGISEFPNPAGRNVKPYQLGGLAMIDSQTLQTIHEVPISEFSPQGYVVTRNPVFVENVGDELRMYAVPDDDHGSLLVYETINLLSK